MIIIDLRSVIKKRLKAEALSETEILSKVHVHEEIMKGSINILYTDGMEYKFNECVSSQQKVWVIYSIWTNVICGRRYIFSTFKHLLENMSLLLVLENLVAGNVEKVLLTFKELMTDQTIMDSSLLIYWNSGEKKLFLLFSRILACCIMLKKKKSARCTMFFVDYMSYITLRHM